MILGLALDIGGAINALGSPFRYGDLGVFISNVVSVGITLGAVATLLYLLWGGFDWLTSGGDKSNIENARNKITAAIVGLIIVAIVWVLFGFVQGFLGINITNGSGVSSAPTPAVQTTPSGFNCPGPHCDRCPGSTSRPPSDIIPCNSSLWNRNAQCAVLYPTQSVGCTKP